MQRTKTYYNKNDVLYPKSSKINTFNIASFDIETYGRENKFLLGGLIDHHGKYHKFSNPREMIEYIKHNLQGVKIYATNLMFDFHALYQLEEEYRNSDLILRGGNLIYAKTDGIEFGDTLNYAMFSVQALGKMLNMPKMATPKRIGFKPKTKNELRYLEQYNRQDCKVSREFMIKFQEVINSLGGELKMTIASTSLDIFLRKYLKTPIYKEKIQKFNDGQRIKDFIFEGYYGGRTECFKRGKYIGKRYFLYDFSSLYPSVMCNEYPLPDSMLIAHIPSEDNIIKYHGVSKVLIECPDMYYPLLPYRKKGKLLFPVGTFTGTYNHIELKKALSLGYKIKRIYKQIFYTKTFYPFKEFIENHYALRLKYINEGNGIYSTIIKTNMNSLYGKFATNHVNRFEFVNPKEKSKIGAYITDIEDMSGYREIPIECEQSYVIPILSSTTTSYGRLKLYDELVRLNGIYCDTDSIISDVEIPSSNKLGELKLEKTFKSFEIVRPKFYSYTDDMKTYVKIKGLKRSENPVKDFETALSKGKIFNMKFTKLKESLRDGMKVNTKKKVHKEFELEDTKRVWDRPYDRKGLIDSRPIRIIP